MELVTTNPPNKPETITVGVESTATQIEINDDTRNELTQWAIHELVEQNVQNEQTNANNKKVMAVLGVVTATLSLTLVISEIIKLWS